MHAFCDNEIGRNLETSILNPTQYPPLCNDFHSSLLTSLLEMLRLHKVSNQVSFNFMANKTDTYLSDKIIKCINPVIKDSISMEEALFVYAFLQ